MKQLIGRGDTGNIPFMRTAFTTEAEIPVILFGAMIEARTATFTLKESKS